MAAISIRQDRQRAKLIQDGLKKLKQHDTEHRYRYFIYVPPALICCTLCDAKLTCAGSARPSKLDRHLAS